MFLSAGFASESGRMSARSHRRDEVGAKRLTAGASAVRLDLQLAHTEPRLRGSLVVLRGVRPSSYRWDLPTSALSAASRQG